jgi:riboflavin synthase
MFTGIIEEVGSLIQASDTGSGFTRVQVGAGSILEGITPGASIAVNGVCLTAVAFDGAGFAADLSAETLERTTLGALRPGSLVNLERPMRADGRFGGHFVQGHVDGVGRILAFDREGDNWNLTVEYPATAARYIVEKGSITVDGISLTVAGLLPAAFTVAIIPHTFENTNLRMARPGGTVNLELDVVAKYVERMLNLQ